MLQYDFEQSVGYWVTTAAHAFERELNVELTPHGITFRQMQVLGCLAMLGAVTQAELAERMNIEAATLVSVLGRMERDGWIRRQACAEDRRKRLIHPTPKAEPAWAKVVACARKIRARAVRGMSADEVRLAMRLLETMRENLCPSKVVAEAS